jgi:hypothetical protein
MASLFFFIFASFKIVPLCTTPAVDATPLYILGDFIKKSGCNTSSNIYNSASPNKFIPDYSTLEADASSFNKRLQSNSTKPRDRQDCAVITVPAS